MGRTQGHHAGARPGPAPGERAEKVVGVLGGMGPLATADFYAKLVRRTPARTDQGHLHVIIDSNPKIPDRTDGLGGAGPDPTPHLVAAARSLERAGAELIAMPCNSAHAYLAAIRKAVRVPVLDIMEEVAAAAAARTPRPRAVGLLAAPGTIRARLYHRALGARGFEVVDTTPVEEAGVEAAIKAVKAGDLGAGVRRRVREAAAALIRRGADVIVHGLLTRSYGKRDNCRRSGRVQLWPPGRPERSGSGRPAFAPAGAAISTGSEFKLMRIRQHTGQLSLDVFLIILHGGRYSALSRPVHRLHTEASISLAGH